MHTPRSSTIPGLAPPPPPPSRAAALHRHLLLDFVHHGPSWDRAARHEWLRHVLAPALTSASVGRQAAFGDETWTTALSTLRSRLDELVAHRDGFVHAAVYKGLVVREAGDWSVDASKVLDLPTALSSLLARDVLRRRATYDDELTFCPACRRYRFVHWEQRPARPCGCRRRSWAQAR